MSDWRHCDREGCINAEPMERNRFLAMGLFGMPLEKQKRFCSFPCLLMAAKALSDEELAKRQLLDRIQGNG